LNEFYYKKEGKKMNYTICRIQSMVRGIPITNAQIYLPTSEDVEELRNTEYTMNIEENNSKKLTDPKNKCFNFEFAMRIIEKAQK